MEGPQEDMAPTMICTPLALTCADNVTIRECSEDGLTETDRPCPDMEICKDGVCLEADCIPGTVLGCQSATSERVCADDGFGYDNRPCAAETPNCLDGQCTAQICRPGSTVCQGDDVTECSMDGLAEIVVETCAHGCEAGACLNPCGGDSKSYLGCDFLAVDLDQFATPCTSWLDCPSSPSCQGLFCQCINSFCEGGAQDQPFAVTVANNNTMAVTATVSDVAGNVVATQTVGVNQVVSIELPSSNINDSSITDKSYRVEADGPVTVHQFNPQNNSDVFSNDASLLLPSNTLGTEYLVMSWPTIGDTTFALKSFVVVVASEMGTTSVTVKTPAAIAAGPGVGAVLAGGTATYSLSTGQVLSLTTQNTSGADLTGMEITADQRVAVFAGTECGNVPLNNQYCDHMEQQLIPVSTWGTDFVAAKFNMRGNPSLGRTEPDIWRILASQDGTAITTTPAIPSVDGQMLARGEFIEFSHTGDFVVTATAPISVGQYMVGSSYPGIENGCDRNFHFNGDTSQCAIPPDQQCSGGGTAIGDPAFLLNVPSSQFRPDYLVLTPNNYREDFLTFIAPIGTTITLDGTQITDTPTPIAGTSWEVIRRSVSDGTHTVLATAPSGLYAYGYDCDVSYAYPGGLNLETL
jgi:hypothetical protein